MRERGIRIDEAMVATEKLDQLYMPEIPMTVPLYDDAILVGSSRKNVSTTTLICGVIEPYRSLSLRRRDGHGINSYTDDSTESRMLVQPARELRLSRQEDAWFIDIDGENVTDRGRLLGFVGVVATFAYKKQRQIETSAAEYRSRWVWSA